MNKKNQKNQKDFQSAESLWKEKIDTNEEYLSSTHIMVDLFGTLESENPFYNFYFDKDNEKEYSKEELKTFRQWYFTTIEGKPFDQKISGMFNCWIDKLQISNNIELLKKYKTILYSSLKQHRTIDSEVQLLMTNCYNNKIEIDKLMNKL